MQASSRELHTRQVLRVLMRDDESQQGAGAGSGVRRGAQASDTPLITYDLRPSDQPLPLAVDVRPLSCQ